MEYTLGRCIRFVKSVVVLRDPSLVGKSQGFVSPHEVGDPFQISCELMGTAVWV